MALTDRATRYVRVGRRANLQTGISTPVVAERMRLATKAVKEEEKKL